jgi:hypothetical protein
MSTSEFPNGAIAKLLNASLLERTYRDLAGETCSLETKCSSRATAAPF